MIPDTGQVQFTREYEHEIETWLRRRFTYLCIAYAVLATANLVSFLLAVVAMVGGEEVSMGRGGTAILAAKGVLSMAVVLGFYARREAHESRQDVLRAAFWMILALGLLSLTSRFLAMALGVTFPASIIFAVFVWHFSACLFLPWTPRESLRPIVPLLALWAVYTLFFDRDSHVVGGLVAVMFSPGILIPGLLICGWRLRAHSRRFRSTMLGRQFRSMRQEFTRARSIHESLFPAEYDDGCVQFQYTYQPMRELGGDYLHVNVGPQGFLHLTLLDVTGHGLPAALTVNRIHGELERIQAESPQAGPGEVLGLLNRYIHLTMVRHNIYATAICLTLDPYVGELRWCSAGHPPGFLRGVNGVVQELLATTVVLGALGDGDFDTDEKSVELSPGDIVVVYTDGTFEARDRHGRQLGLDSLRSLMHSKPPPANWPHFIAASVDKHKAGRSEDDVLVASLTFSGYRMETRKAATAHVTP